MAPVCLKAAVAHSFVSKGFQQVCSSSSNTLTLPSFPAKHALYCTVLYCTSYANPLRPHTITRRLLLAVLLQDFCSRKAAVAAAGGSTEESETWTFMGVLFEEDARRQLLAKLGFSDAMLPQTTSAAAAAGGRAG